MTPTDILIAIAVFFVIVGILTGGKKKTTRKWRKGGGRRQGWTPRNRTPAQPSPSRKIPFQPSQSSAKKGEEGEVAVYYALSAFTKERGFHRYHNLIIPDGRGGTTEIDAVMFSRFGVFVLEIKNYSGWIFGKKNESHWTHLLRYNKKPFPNPIRQNQNHIRALQTLTGLPGGCFCNIVVFAGNAEFKTPIPDGVVYLHDLADSISATAQTTLLTDAQIQNAIMVMLENNQANKRPDATTQHHNYVQELRQ